MARTSTRSTTEKPVARRAKPEAEEAPVKRTRTKPTEDLATAKRRVSKIIDKVETTAKRKLKEIVEEPAPKRGRRSTVISEEPEVPVKRTRRAKAEVAEEVPAKRTRSKAATVEPEEKPVRKSKAASVVVSAFNPYAQLDDVLDNIEKDVGLSESSMDPSETRLSTGMLMLDILLGGGITAGWYTNFGQEQCCKTTGAVTMLSAALNSDVPVITYFDFEGCLTYEAEITVNGNKQPIGMLFDGMELVPYMAVDTRNLNISVETPCGMQPVTAAMYKGPKPCIRVELANGKHLEGYKHKELVCTSEGLLVWKYIEDLVIGDNLVVQGTPALLES